MSIYSKLAEARVTLQSEDLKKSGENTHTKFKYFELKDFLPEINVINKNLGIISLFNITEKIAVLKIVDEKEGTEIVFTSPIAEAKLNGKPSPIQELGSQHTYMRRYMYTLAYEIVVADEVDKELGKPEVPKTEEELKKEAEATEIVRQGMIEKNNSLIAELGIEENQILKRFKCAVEDMKIPKLEELALELRITKNNMKKPINRKD